MGGRFLFRMSALFIVLVVLSDSLTRPLGKMRHGQHIRTKLKECKVELEFFQRKLKERLSGSVWNNSIPENSVSQTSFLIPSA